MANFACVDDTTANVASIDLARIPIGASGGGNIVSFAGDQIGSTTTYPGGSLETILQMTYSSN
jgi:hypothetical protein